MSARAVPSRGFTLVEMLVALAILSILAMVALPYAELTITRGKELELRRTLREVRTAIDRFHDDWENGKLSKLGDNVSEDGYPKTLEALVEGAESGTAKGVRLKYLRRIPEDPFGRPGVPPASQWTLRGYRDSADSQSWNGKDVYDLRTQSDRHAIDGTRYRDW